MILSRNSYYSLLIVMLGLLPACDFNQPAATEAPTLKVVNVLDPEQYDDAHIKGSINLSFEQLEEQAKKWDKNTPVVIYCSNYMCTGSMQGAKALAAMGFKNVYAYEGGTAEWYQLGKNDSSYMLEGPAQQSYLNIIIEKPAAHEPGVQVISAEELKKMIKDANL